MRLSRRHNIETVQGNIEVPMCGLFLRQGRDGNESVFTSRGRRMYKKS